MSSLGAIHVTTDLTWPWSYPGVGPFALVVVAALIAGLTVWTYRDIRQATPRRVFLLLGLRLFALAMALLAILRPSLAIQKPLTVPTTLLLALDRSQSMTIQDQHNELSRWAYLKQLVGECQPEFERLARERQVSIRFHTFADTLGEYAPDQQADGKRTDFGRTLQAVAERYAGEKNLLGLLVLSDGADNGRRLPALTLAGRVRSMPCSIFTFAFGKTTTTSHQHDISMVSILPEPAPVPIKAKLTVRGIIDAPGFERASVHVRLELNDKEVAAGDFELKKTNGNEVRLECDAPETPGEVKVTLKADALPGELSALNNEISTYVTVTKEGISVLYVEGKVRAWEPKFIRQALKQLPNVRLFDVERLQNAPAAHDEKDVLQVGKHHYDVIILGDISAQRLSGGDRDVLAELTRQVADKGTGLLMIGGYESFANSDWDKTDIARLLPVQLDRMGQDESDVQMEPTLGGLTHFIMRLSDREADNAAVWRRLPKLAGMTRLGTPKPGALVLAKSSRGEPILVGMISVGKGRSLAFAADTTWRWCRSIEDMRLHARFWQQMVLWLAKKEESDGSLLIVPESRRLPAGSKVGFHVVMRGKGGVTIAPENMQVEVNVRQPDGVTVKVPVAAEQGEMRGDFIQTDAPGEYEMSVQGSGKESDGTPVQGLTPGSARFLIYQDEMEMAVQAADHAFLERLALAGGGKAFMAEDVKSFLRSLESQPQVQAKNKPELWPDWRRAPASRSATSQWSALAGSGILACYLLFVAAIAIEWLLRRVWGLV